MDKNYPDQLGNWVMRNPSTRRERNLVAFLAVRDDVRSALQVGYPVKTIWANMREAKRVAFGYDAFLHYVHQYVSDGQPNASHWSSPSSVAALDASKKPDVAGPTTSPSGFTFNPTPNKEELL